MKKSTSKEIMMNVNVKSTMKTKNRLFSPDKRKIKVISKDKAKQDLKGNQNNERERRG